MVRSTPQTLGAHQNLIKPKNQISDTPKDDPESLYYHQQRGAPRTGSLWLAIIEEDEPEVPGEANPIDNDHAFATALRNDVDEYPDEDN